LERDSYFGLTVALVKNIATWIREVDEAAFARTFALYPDLRLWNARVEAVPEEIDALLLSGGEDISREFLRQPVPDPSLIHDTDVPRDKWEFAILPRVLERRLPIFAICRGIQVLNVVLGGTLVLDIPGHAKFKFDNVQELRFVNDAAIRIPRVNSSHHQALDQLGAGLVVEARHAEDETIEQARVRDYPFCLGVQFHPERDPLYQPLFDAFVAAIRTTPHE
jgi:putative glutamine amidotransferase